MSDDECDGTGRRRVKRFVDASIDHGEYAQVITPTFFFKRQLLLVDYSRTCQIWPKERWLTGQAAHGATADDHQQLVQVRNYQEFLLLASKVHLSRHVPESCAVSPWRARRYNTGFRDMPT